MAETNNDLWLQLTAESDIPDDSTPVDLAIAKDMIRAHNESNTAHADIREEIQAIADQQTQEIKEYGSKREFPASGDTAVTIYIDVSTGNLYRYNTSARQYEALAMDTIPSSIALDGVPTAPTARTGTNTAQIATTAFVQHELAAIREQNETTTPVYYDSRTKAKLSLQGANGTIITNVADGKVEQGSSDAVTGGQLWLAQKDMSNMSALAARNIAANAAEIDLLKRAASTNIVGTNVDIVLSEENESRVFTLSVPTDGIAEEDDTGIVSGGTLYDAIAGVKSYIKAGTGIAVNDGVVSIDDTVATKEDLEQATLASRFKIINGDHTAAMLGEAEGQPTYAINVRANGRIQLNDGRIITGGRVYEETRLEEDGNIVRMNNTAAQNIAALDEAFRSVSEKADSIPDFSDVTNGLSQLGETVTTLSDTVAAQDEAKADRDLSNLTETGIQLIKDLADIKALKIINGDHTTATFGNENGIPTYSINVHATGAIAGDDGRIVTGKTVYQEIHVPEDGNYIQSSVTVADNLKFLDMALADLNESVPDGNKINDCVTGIAYEDGQLQITAYDDSVDTVPLFVSLTDEDINTLFE